MTPERRSGPETRAEILRVALRLFSEKGFEGTSTRDISTALGITKSSLYYHFENKDAIVASLLGERVDDLEALVEWIEEQPPAPDLLRRAALRWVDSATPERLATMRLAHANQPVLLRIAGGGVRAGFEEVVDLLAGERATAEDRLYVRMAFDTVGAALLASLTTGATPEQIIATARRATLALTA